MTYNIRLDKVELLEKLVYKNTLQEIEATFNFEVTTRSIARRDISIVINFVSVTVRKENTSDVLANFLVACGFFIENYEESIPLNDNGKDIVPIDLDNILKTISISTVRGIMYSELRGTHLHAAYLPIIMADQLKPVQEKTTEK